MHGMTPQSTSSPQACSLDVPRDNIWMIKLCWASACFETQGCYPESKDEAKHLHALSRCALTPTWHLSLYGIVACSAPRYGRPSG